MLRRYGFDVEVRSDPDTNFRIIVTLDYPSWHARKTSVSGATEGLAQVLVALGEELAEKIYVTTYE